MSPEVKVELAVAFMSKAPDDRGMSASPLPAQGAFDRSAACCRHWRAHALRAAAVLCEPLYAAANASAAPLRDVGAWISTSESWAAWWTRAASGASL